MNRTELYELAHELGKSLATVSGLGVIDSSVSKAQEQNKIADEDYQTFKNDVMEARQHYQMLAQQKLPSEFKAAQPKQA